MLASPDSFRDCFLMDLTDSTTKLVNTRENPAEACKILSCIISAARAFFDFLYAPLLAIDTEDGLSLRSHYPLHLMERSASRFPSTKEHCTSDAAK